MAKGAFPESHPLAFGSPGMHGGTLGEPGAPAGRT